MNLLFGVLGMSSLRIGPSALKRYFPAAVSLSGAKISNHGKKFLKS